jgi:hypothetical protein
MKTTWLKWTMLWTGYGVVQVILFFFIRLFLSSGISGAIVFLASYYSLIPLQRSWFRSDLAFKPTDGWTTLCGIIFIVLCSFIKGSEYWVKGLFFSAFYWCCIGGLISGFFYGAMTGFLKMRSRHKPT